MTTDYGCVQGYADEFNLQKKNYVDAARKLGAYDFVTTFSHTLESFRKTHNLTQQMAAAELCVAMRTFQSWEGGFTLPHPDRRKMVEQRMKEFEKLTSSPA